MTAVDQAIAKRKLRPALREWAVSFASKDPAGFAEWVEAASPIFSDPVGSDYDPPVLEFAGLRRVQAIGFSILTSLEDFRRNQAGRDRASRLNGLAVELHRFHDALRGDVLSEQQEHELVANSAAALRQLRAARDAKAIDAGLRAIRATLDAALRLAYTPRQGRPKGIRALDRRELTQRLRIEYAKLQRAGQARPSQLRVARELGIHRTTLTRYLREYEVAWPPRK